MTEKGEAESITRGIVRRKTFSCLRVLEKWSKLPAWEKSTGNPSERQILFARRQNQSEKQNSEPFKLAFALSYLKLLMYIS